MTDIDKILGRQNEISKNNKYFWLPIIMTSLSGVYLFILGWLGGFPRTASFIMIFVAGFFVPFVIITFVIIWFLLERKETRKRQEGEQEECLKE